MTKFETVPPEQARWHCDLAQFKFKTTNELKGFSAILGQDRAVRSINAGLDMNYAGYNIFVSGASGTGRATTVKLLLQQRKNDKPSPEDICYVNNFKNPDLPIVLTFRAGQGCQFKNDMEALVEQLQNALPQIFESEKYHQKRESIEQKYDEKQKKNLEEFESKTASENFTLVQIQVGPYTKPDILPIIKDQPLPLEQLPQQVQEGTITEKEMEKILKIHEEFTKELGRIFKENQKIQREKTHKINSLDYDMAKPAIADAVNELQEKYAGEKVHEYLKSIEENVLMNLKLFREVPDAAKTINSEAKKSFMPDQFLEYRVNVIVDNRDTKGAPVIFENGPSFAKLFGTIEKVVDAKGQWRTDFTKIRAGSLLMANGGFLVLYARDVLVEQGVWNNLKRNLKSRQTEIQGYDPFFMISATAIKPEPIDIDLQVILIGEPDVYHLLYEADPDFNKIFKVKADFDYVMKNEKDNLAKYAEFIKKICDDENLLPFDRAAVGAIVEYGVRLAGRQNKISTRFNYIADLVREASYYAQKSNAKIVLTKYVDEAISEKIFRVNLIEEKIQEMIEEGTIMIDTKGKVVGQVNGLSVLSLGDYSFGRPSRITAQVSIGRAGIINIEREVALSGPTHDKGVLIIAGYLRGKFAHDKPLAMSASICFEQSYSGVDGDSASSTEVYALLSSLAETPLRQDVAVTGSVNQKGEIQPIGGVNEKIEGFFKVCKAAGLTGSQGVMIPRQNVDDLMLSKEVAEHIKKQKFSIFPIDTIDQGIELLSGLPAGTRDAQGKFPPDSVYGKVDIKLAEFANSLKTFSSHETF